MLHFTFVIYCFQRAAEGRVNPLPLYVFLSVTFTHTQQTERYNDRLSPFCVCVCGASWFLSVSSNI